MSGIIIWLVKNYCENRFFKRPRLMLKLGKTFYGHRFKGHIDGRHELHWRYECTLKNNSGNIAYNVQIFQVRSLKNPFVFNKSDFSKKLPPLNSIGINSEVEFILSTSFITEPDELLRFKIEDGKKIYLPGLKYQNPQEKYKPEGLNQINLILKYENEKGKVFYTEFTKTNEDEKNKLTFFKFKLPEKQLFDLAKCDTNVY